MRAFVVMLKVFREVRRDLLVVALSLSFAPGFVLLYYVVFPQVAPVYRVAVVDRDTGAVGSDGRAVAAGRDLEAALMAAREASGRPLLQVTVVATREQGLDRVRRHESTAVLVIPAGFSRAIAGLQRDPQGAEPVAYTLTGDLTQPGYVVTATLADATVQDYVQRATGRSGPVRVVEEPLGGSGARTDFELYVPGLIVFAVILMIFLAAMTVAREIESGAMRRLRLTRMTSADYLLGTSSVIMLLGIVSVLLTFATAWLCGFRSQGPIWIGVVVLAITTMSVIGIGMMVAAVSRSVAQAFVIANFPLGLLMFFSGSILPMPRVTWLTVLGHPVGPFEVLPPTHAVTALNTVFTMGGGFADVVFEVVCLLALTAAYFAAGMLLLRRTRHRAG